MFKKILTTLFALVLTGCATTSQYGNFINADQSGQQPIVADAVQQLSTLYPPAHTRFTLKQETPDHFGVSLINALRERGYAVAEYAPPTAIDTVNKALDTNSDPAGIELRYVLDQAGIANLYRLTLLIGQQSITRPYVYENGVYVPAGHWSRFMK